MSKITSNGLFELLLVGRVYFIWQRVPPLPPPLASPALVFYINSFEISRRDRGDLDRYADKDSCEQSLDTLIYS